MAESKSVMSNEKECYICGAVYPLQVHHIFFGSGNRQISDRTGAWCYLCVEHHIGSNVSVHRNREADLKLKRRCQEILEKKWSRERFIETFGRSYAD